jgi:hypothetical protein
LSEDLPSLLILLTLLGHGDLDGEDATGTSEETAKGDVTDDSDSDDGVDCYSQKRPPAQQENDLDSCYFRTCDDLRFARDTDTDIPDENAEATAAGANLIKFNPNAITISRTVAAAAVQTAET